MKLQGKIAIVTGSSRGLGKGIAKAFAKEGASVVVAARSETEGSKLPGSIASTVSEIQEDGGAALAIRCDVRDESSVKSMIERTLEAFGKIDILVNNAGGAFAYKRIVDLPLKRFDQIVAVNVRGPFLTSQAVLPSMIERRRGCIINITSGASHRFSRMGDTVYGLTKAALDRFSVGLGWEVREHNISVVAVAPGRVRTEAIESMYSDMEMDWDASDWQRPEDLGPPLVWLAQQDSQTFTMRIVNAMDFGRVWP